MIDRRITTGARLSFAVRASEALVLHSSIVKTSPVRTCVRLRWRAHGVSGAQNTSLNPASHPSAAYLPILPGSGKLRTAIERTNSLVALAVRPFISRGTRLICNLRGGFKALRSLFPSNPLVPLLQETTCGGFECFIFAKVAPSAVAHESNIGRRNGQSAVKG